jgi:hypothetical protein
MSSFLDELTLFDRINIAHCATKRAQEHVCNNDRFTGEFETAYMWNKYRCYITKTHSFVEKY